MKKILLSIFCMISLVSAAQTVIISDNFDSYTAGAPLAANSTLWTTWSGGIPGEDANVDSTQSSSPPNSLYIIGNNGPTDLVLPFPADYTAGVYELTMKIFIVTGKGGYFNLQSNMSPGMSWMLEVYFDNAGGGTINAGGAGAAAFSYNPNAWNDIKVNVNLTGDTAKIFINNALTHTWQWTLGSDGNGAPLSWGGMNIYAAATTPPGDGEFYVDDVVLTDLTVTGINETSSFSQISLFPNPAHDIFELVYFSPSTSEATLQLINLAGEKIIERSQNITTGKNRIIVNEPALPAGMYFLQLLSAEKTISQKIVIEK